MCIGFQKFWIFKRVSHFFMLSSIHRKIWRALCIKKTLLYFTLAGVAQWVKHRPANQKVAGLILVRSAGQVLGYGWARGNWLMFLSFSFYPLSPVSKNTFQKSKNIIFSSESYHHSQCMGWMKLLSWVPSVQD